MSDTNRYMTHRRSAVRASGAPIKSGDPGRVPAPPQAASVTSPARVEALRRLVAAGQYHVSPRWLATRIFHAAGVKPPV